MRKFIYFLLLVFLSFSFANQQKIDFQKNTGDKVDISVVEKKAAAINDFIEREKKLIDQIYKKGSLMLLLDIDEAQKQINQIYEQLNDVSQELESVYKKKKQVDKKYYEVLSGIRLILKDIQQTKQQIDKRLIRIKLYSLKIIELRKQIVQIRKDLDVLKKNLAVYTKILYSINNTIYDSDFKIDDLKLLLKSDNISKTLSKQDIVRLLTAKMKELMAELDKKNKKLTYYIKEVNYLKIKYTSEVKGYQRELEMLNQQKKYLTFLFDYLKIDKKEYDKKFKYLFESRRDLKRQLVSLLILTKKKLDKVNLGS
jgi:chromosome segregation ATPase